VSIFSKLLSRKPAPEEEIAEEPVEHRSTDRVGTFKVVHVTYPTGYVRRGIIVDISPTGARVRFSQRGELPERVDVKIEGVPGTRQAEVVWQETHDAGLRFET